MSVNYDPEVLFREEQRFDQLWVRAIVYISFLVTAGVLFTVFVMGKRMPPGSALHGALVIAVTVFVVDVLLTRTGMVTEVRTDGLIVHAIPFASLRRRIPFDQVASAEARRYNPLLEYGGWGIRFGPRGKAYNVKGNQGVQLVLRSGEKVLIGSQRAEDLASEIGPRIGT